jgi:uncharacterized membrane protein
MAPNKNLWTPAMYQKLLNGTSFLMAGFVALTLVLIVPFMFLGFIGEEFGIILLLLLVWPVCCLVGLAKIRGVFRDLVAESGGMPAKEVMRTSVWPQASPLDTPRPVATKHVSPLAEAEVAWQKANVSAPVRAVKKAAPVSREPAVKIDWEEWVGKKLLQKAGMVIVLIGMLVFLKYSFDNGIIDELGRVLMSAVIGGALLGAGEVFHKKYSKWSQAFTGGGLALLYLTVWVAHVLYAQELAVSYSIVVPDALAFVLYSFITFIGALASVRYKAQTIAWFTVLGGYLTPLIVNTSAPDHTALLLYLAILAGGIILLAWRQKWKHLNIAAFGFTQFYLYTSIYTAVPEFGDVQQIITASAFFLLFNVLPLLYQFRLKLKADREDIWLIILNGVAVFLPVVDATGGWESGYVGVICLALAAFYMVFSAMALNNRGEDETLVNTYLVGTVLLVAGAMFAELRAEWVAMGWAPLSVLLVFISARLKRAGPWVCAIILLVGSLFFLAINMPVFTRGIETLWHPFTSNWAIQSYVVFASVLAWMAVSAQLPQTLLKTEQAQSLKQMLHAVLAILVFFAVTFEATGLNFEVDVLWTVAYIVLAVAAIGVFFLTESLVWFVLAFVVQLISLSFIFWISDNSGMAQYLNQSTVQPILHPWGYTSVLALLASFCIVYVARLKRGRFASGLPVQELLIGIAMAQVWVHVSVEIANLSHAYNWSYLLFDRSISVWWIAFALVTLGIGALRNHPKLRMAGIILLALPFIRNHLSILNGQDRMIETIVWTALSLGVAVTGIRLKSKEILYAGIAFLLGAMGADMVAHLGDGNAGLVRSSWWALSALATMIAGFMEREKMLRQVAMVIFGATAIKLLLVDFSGLETPVRIGASIVTGLLMIGASYLYQRFDSMLGSSSSAK